MGVTTTGVFCRLTCSARKPKREHCEFFADVGSAVDAGYRPCKRCRPLEAPVDPLVTQLTNAIGEEPRKRWREADLADRGLDPSTARRAFKRQLGMTFLQVARARRLGHAATQLASGASVIDAQLDAGYGSGSGFREAFARLLGDAPARIRAKAYLTADWILTPLGPMIAIADDDALHLLEFADRTALPTEIARLRSRSGLLLRHGRNRPIDRIAAELDRYFAGSKLSFDTPVAEHGTDFERSVWQELRRIPAGETRSYRDIARALGRDGAERAVARANGANQLALVIPCHRVIASDGALSGYGGKVWRKRWLLEHERRVAAS